MLKYSSTLQSLCLLANTLRMLRASNTTNLIALPYHISHSRLANTQSRQAVPRQATVISPGRIRMAPHAARACSGAAAQPAPEQEDAERLDAEDDELTTLTDRSSQTGQQKKHLVSQNCCRSAYQSLVH